MRIRSILKPGQRGTKRLVEQYGESLLCVRYRYDEASRKRLKTIELVIEESDWSPKIASESIVGVQVAFREADLQQKVRQAGGKWNPARRVWELRYDRAVALGLKDRLAPEDVSISRNKKASTNRN
jgi:hypothetical protein